MDYFLTEEEKEIFASLKDVKGDFPPVWSPFVLYGKDNPSYGIGCPTSRFVRDEEFKKRMSDKIKESFRNGRVHPRTGIDCPENVKMASSKANSKSFKVTHPDGSIEIITNLLQWSKENGHVDIAIYKSIKNNKPYKGMTFERLDK